MNNLCCNKVHQAVLVSYILHIYVYNASDDGNLHAAFTRTDSQTVLASTGGTHRRRAVGACCSMRIAALQRRGIHDGGSEGVA